MGPPGFGVQLSPAALLRDGTRVLAFDSRAAPRGL